MKNGVAVKWVIDARGNWALVPVALIRNGSGYIELHASTGSSK